MEKKWIYKKFCKRCGKLRVVNGKYASYCEECTKPRFGEDQSYKALLKENEVRA